MKLCAYCLTEINFSLLQGSLINLPDHLILLDIVGSDFDHLKCPKCGSNNLERHLRLYCDVLQIFQSKENLRILHFAPEPGFVSYISQFKPELHIFADYHPKHIRSERIDICSIPYSDESFDVVIANHILEHVPNPEQALSEINRVLKSDGTTILQTPFSNVLSRTFEDPGLNTPELRAAFYGQEDRVRLFGKNIFDIFTTYLDGRVRQHSDVFNSTVADRFGVNAREPFFLFSKKTLAPPEIIIRRPFEPYHGEPVVSIYCITYNHEKYISAALDGLLAQRTDFPFEIVLGEDCSTDNTLEIIEKYQGEYPGFIKLIRGEKNVGVNRNAYNTMKACTGEFVAICEGDDYWTDIHKLQKQVDFLRANSDFVLTYGSVISHTPYGIDYNYNGGIRVSSPSNELLRAPSINTLTAMYRNVVKPLPNEFFTTGAGDMFIWSLLGHHGAGKYMPEILPSVYRQHTGGIHSSKTLAEKISLSLMTMYSLFLYYRRTDNTELTNFFLTRSYFEATEIFRRSQENSADNPIFYLVDRMCKLADGIYDFDHSVLRQIINTAQSRLEDVNKQALMS